MIEVIITFFFSNLDARLGINEYGRVSEIVIIIIYLAHHHHEKKGGFFTYIWGLQLQGSRADFACYIVTYERNFLNTFIYYLVGNNELMFPFY